MSSIAVKRAETLGQHFTTSSLKNRGWPAWSLAVILVVFYIVLYYSELFNKVMDPIFHGKADKWTLYGFLYTVAVLWGGIVFILKNKRSRYQIIRTSVIMCSQVVLAFFIPTFMRMLGTKDFYFSYLWPLKIEYLYPNVIFSYPLPIVFYSFLMSLIVFPLLAFFFGKRFYCSWICGCGGLANTFGDPWRHLSTKTKRAWKFEVISIHSTLVFALFATAVMIINWGIGQNYPRFAQLAWKVQSVYGFVVGFFLAGMAGVALYPLMGTRVWCRFFCPMAALLGLIQRIGWFHIASQGELCIACGNCSKYCEMGIDVRAYAMKGEDFTRASCVGCGMCAHVCPRGVLKLEIQKKTAF
ncbi:4Fe-4S binding protein [candidate division CSSED10-310 bacterium]|uniref:4Fe-4S binding protein n=1 Tax=candidate division CSSED10-310 bacterium TaxID=2855610 RepID=A0ABV6YYL9_UNCC1